MSIHFRDEVVLSKTAEANRNKGIQTEPALKGKEHICKSCIFRKPASKHEQDCQPTNNAISFYVNQKLYLHVFRES